MLKMFAKIRSTNKHTSILPTTTNKLTHYLNYGH